MATVSGKRTLYSVVSDHLATPQMLLGGTNKIVWQADYDGFGKAVINPQQVTFNLRFPGQYYDKETGLHYNYFRDYDPALGRYVQSDPIGLGGGINTYGYVGGNPIGAVDPLGLAVCWMSVSGGWLKCISNYYDTPGIDINVSSGNNGAGMKCKNNPDCDGFLERGPIPLGEWRWCGGQDTNTKENGRRLCPGPDTNSKNRTGLLTHSCPYPFGPALGGADGTRFCSKGCVTGLPGDMKKLNDIIDNEPGSLLYVYP